MVEQTDKLVKGLKIVLKIFPDAKGYFGIEDNKPEAIEALLKATENEDRIEVVPLKTKYPQGGERSMIYAVTGRKSIPKCFLLMWDALYIMLIRFMQYIMLFITENLL